MRPGSSALCIPAWFASIAYKDGFRFPRHLHVFQRECMNMLINSMINRLIVQVPVRHGKSRWFSQIFVAWYACTHPANKVLLATGSEDLRKEFSAEVVRLVRLMSPLYGLTIDPKWDRNDSFRFLEHLGGFDSVTAGGSILGRGYHLIVADDLYPKEETGRSPAQRRNVSYWFNFDLMTRLEPGCKVILVMSRQHLDDISGECQATNKELPPELTWRIISFKAIQDDGTALWPERYSIQWLNNKRAEWELKGRGWAFDAQYQQDPRANPELSCWPDSYFKDIFYDQLPPDLPIKYKIVACDASAGSESNAGDFAAIPTLMLTHNDHIWIDSFFMERCPWAKAAEACALTIIKEQPLVGVIEGGGFQDAVKQKVDEILVARGCHTPTVSFDAHEAGNKKIRIRLALEQWLCQHRLHIRKSVAGVLCVNQMREHPTGAHDDGPDAITMGLYEMGELSG